jgi:sugar lactone lactonase YvrE
MPAGNLVVLAEGLTSPDDLAQAPDGSIYLTDSSDGTLLRYVSGQVPAVIATGLSVPEGIAVLPNGDLIIAEQGKNRLVRYNPASGQITPFLALGNSTANSGLDGIALDDHDPASLSLLVPDSPKGTLLRVSLDGNTVRQIASGFVRPVAASVEKDGSILVADEFGNALKRVRPDGTIGTVARLPQPDDVIVDGAGNIYVNCLVDGAVHRIAAETGVDSVVASGLDQPQGIAFDTQGNLLVSDTGHHRLVRITLR